MTEQQQDDGHDSTQGKPRTNDQGFVAMSEFPSCSNEDCDGERLVISKSREGFQGLHCEKCGRILRHFNPASTAIDEEDEHFAVVGQKAHGTGRTKDEAVENMKEYLDDDALPVYSVYVSNKPVNVSRYGQVIGEDGSDVILHYLGKETLDM